MSAPTPRIMLRVACGPRRGFGHAVRALRLASELDAPVWISFDGPVPAIGRSPRVTRLVGGVRALDEVRPSLLVLDTPVVRDGRRWLDAARRRGIAVASIHDRGIAPLASDLAVDGSLAALGPIEGAGRTLVGPRFMVIDPGVLQGPASRRDDESLVVIALGGGPRVGLAHAISREIIRRAPSARIAVASGFGGATPSARSRRVEWLGPRESLTGILRSARTAVVAGGVTLYEAAALGVPTVAIPIVAAQRPTVRAFARAGAALAPSRSERIDVPAVAAAVERLLSDRAQSARLARRGRQLVDGHGGRRVAHALALLAGGRR